MPPKVAIIGHFVPAPAILPAPKNPLKLSALLHAYNYNRVLTDDNELVDHLAYLKRERGAPAQEPYSVWEMYLCAGLLLNSHLERHGVATLLVTYIASDNQESALRRLRDFNPDIVALSSTFMFFPKHLCDAVSAIRGVLPRACIVAGGHHVFTALMNMNAEEKKRYLAASGVDAFIDDVQGEKALLDLARAWPADLAAVPNLIWKNRGSPEATINARRSEDNDINSTPIEFTSLPPGAIVHVRTARSCAFTCAFCSYPAIAGDLALMDLDNAVATVRRARAAGVSSLIFVDDTFNVPQPRFEAFLDRLIAEKLRVPWYSFLRCQFVTERLVEKMKESGCAGVFLGLESGSDRVLKNMMKGGKVKSYAPGIQWLKNNGIFTVGSFVIGFPGETAETVAETKDFIENAGFDFYFMQPFYYQHHTPIHQSAARYGLEGKALLWKHSTMDSVEARRHMDELFRTISGPTFVNPDTNLWEVAYLRSKGMSLDEIHAYRKTINAMTVAQMTRVSSPASQTTGI